MANPTYSLAVTGLVPGQSTNKQWDIPDTCLDVTGSAACATAGGQQRTMALGDQMLVKGPDGSLHWYKFDPERSTKANPVLLFVGP